jgi:RNA polymerase sigma factor (sigma-70 family)
MAASGDGAAYEAVVRRYEPALRRYCRRLTRDDARADDAVQQALVSAWSALRQGADVRDLKAWLHRIAHNAVVRGVTRERESPGFTDVDERAQSASAVIELSMQTRAALTAVAALPAHQRAALVGTAIDGRSRGEMARELGLSEGAVRQLLHRARATLRAAIAAAIPVSPVVRFVRRRSEGLPVPDAAPLAGGSAGAVVAAACKAGAIRVAVGGLAAVPVAHTLRARNVSASQPAASVTGSYPGVGTPPAPGGIDLRPIAYEHGDGARTTTSASPAAVAVPGATDATDPSAGDPGSDGGAGPNAGDAGGDSSQAAGDSADPSSDVTTDGTSDATADPPADPGQTSHAGDPAADPSPPVDPAPDPTPDPPPVDAAPVDPLLTPYSQGH